MAKRARTRKVNTSCVGVKDVLDLLDEVEDSVAGALNEASKAGAEFVATEARANVAVRTGALKNAIEIKVSKTRTKKYARTFKPIVNYLVGPRYAKMLTKGGVNYGHAVELGHKTLSGKEVKAQPYLRPAVDRNKRTIANIISIRLGRALKGIR